LQQLQIHLKILQKILSSRLILPQKILQPLLILLILLRRSSAP